MEHTSLCEVLFSTWHTHGLIHAHTCRLAATPAVQGERNGGCEPVPTPAGCRPADLASAAAAAGSCVHRAAPLPLLEVTPQRPPMRGDTEARPRSFLVVRCGENRVNVASKTQCRAASKMQGELLAEISSSVWSYVFPTCEETHSANNRHCLVRDYGRRFTP
eukprot:316661-Chlamydomonas_euryale.AAC.1